MSPFATIAFAQEVVGDLLAGKLVNPKVGQWAWYNLVDTHGGQKYVVRQAIVGEEAVAQKTGYWVEFEIIPEAGFKAVYKMLLTGPAGDPENVHRIIEKSGPDPATEMPLNKEAAKGADKSRAKRKSLGMDVVTTLDGNIRAEHFDVDDAGHAMQLWVNEEVTPSGVVKLKSPDGEMTLRNYGIGGDAAKSVITEIPVAADSAEHQAPAPKVEIGADAGPKRNPKIPNKLRNSTGAKK